MQIFCDESGGFDKAKHSLIVSAVAIDSHDANRLMKKFGKSVSSDGEVKGGLLLPGDRIRFFDMLTELQNTSIVVHCRKSTQLGSYLSSALPEREVYKHMLAEACLDLPNRFNGPVFITPDSGRYPRATLREIASAVEQIIGNASGRKTKVLFEQSDTTAGIQIADIVANTVYQHFGGSENDITENEACGELARQGRLIVKQAIVTKIAPKWIAAE
jgi:hypothetical protein